MMIKDVILAIALLVIIGVAVFAIVRSKKSGKKCIGCPDSCCCSKKGSGCSGTCSE